MNSLTYILLYQVFHSNFAASNMIALALRKEDGKRGGGRVVDKEERGSA